MLRFILSQSLADYWVCDLNDLTSGMVYVAEKRGAELMMQGNAL